MFPALKAVNSLGNVMDIFIPAARRAASRAPYPYRKVKEIHEFLVSWLLWLAVLLVDAYTRRDDDDGGIAQDGGHIPLKRLTSRCIGHPC